MFSYLSGKLREAGKRVDILVHRDELADQVSRTLGDFDVSHGRVISGDRSPADPLVNVNSVFTLIRRLDERPPPDYAIIDEAHHAAAGSVWAKVFAHWRARNPDVRLIGTTATPCRLSGEPLGDTFDDMVLAPDTAHLIQAGALSRFRLLAPPGGPDLSEYRRTSREASVAALDAAMDRPVITGSAIEHYRTYLNGAPSVAFCVSVKHAENVAEQFRADGFIAAGIDGTMDRAERKRRIESFSRGEIHVLTSCDLISEGFDVPGIVGALLLRPTKSLAMYLQQTGRTLRIAQGKQEAIILDHVNNSETHGLPDDPREWSLSGRIKRKSSDDPTPVVRRCLSCFSCAAGSAKSCPCCGAPFPLTPREIEVVEGELVERQRQEAKRAAWQEERDAQSMDALAEIARRRGYNKPTAWAKMKWEGRQARQARLRGTR